MAYYTGHLRAISEQFQRIGCATLEKLEIVLTEMFTIISKTIQCQFYSF